MNLLRLFRRNTTTALATVPASTALATRAAGYRAPEARGAVAPPVRKQGGGFGWSLESIRSARDAQLRGQFDQPVRLAEAFRTNDAMFTAYQTRVSTQSAIRLLWRAADSEAGRALKPLIERSIITPQHARESILGTLANHGVAIGYVEQTTEDDPERGPVVRMTLTEWPLEHVRYNPSALTLETRTRDNGTVTITHGDGRWIVFRKFGVAPWTQDACVLPGALVWAAHGGCMSDWAGASFSHGQPKVIGTLREGVTLQNADGTLTPEAHAVLNVISALVSGEAGAGIMPAGSEAKLLYNGSTAWQVFKELGLDRGKAAQRIYLGTDAALGSQGGAPGVDIESLFSVASTRIQGDLEALERGFREGMIEPWARLHGIAAADLSTCTYAMPDADGERRASQESDSIERLVGMVKNMKDAGLEVTQDTVDAIVDVLGVSVPCKLAATETQAVPLQLAPTDVARVVKVREARQAQGLPALGDERDELMISQLEEQAKAAAAGAAPPPEGGPPTAPTDGGEPPASPPLAPNPDGTITVERVTPATLATAPGVGVVTRAGAIDADGDGKINEAEAEAGARAAGEAIDGDGDGKLDEAEDDDPRVVKARKKVAKALEKYEAKKAQREALEKQRDEATARKDAAEERQQKAADDLDAAEEDAATAADDGDTEAAAKHKETAKALKAEHKAAAKEARAAEREADKLDDKISGHDDGTDALDEALDEYAGARTEVADEADGELRAFEDSVFGADKSAQLPPEQAEQHASLKANRDKRAAQATEAEHLVNGGGDYAAADKPDAAAEDAPNTDSPDRAKAVVTGPKGGKYYLAPSGEKVYVP